MSAILEPRELNVRRVLNVRGTKTQRKETKTIKITRIKSEEKAESKGTKEEKKLTERIENQTQTIEAVLWA